jgi:hypothetical protein
VTVKILEYTVSREFLHVVAFLGGISPKVKFFTEWQSWSDVHVQESARNKHQHDARAKMELRTLDFHGLRCSEYDLVWQRMISHEFAARARKKPATTTSRIKFASDQLGISTKSRRLVHVAEDVQESFLDELRKLKNERDSLKAQISQTKALSSTMPDAELVANRIDKRLARIKSVSDCVDIAEAREILADQVEKIEVATDGQAWPYPKPFDLLAGLLDVNQGNGYIPRGFEPRSNAFRAWSS